MVALQAHDLYLMPSQFFPNVGSKITIGFHVGDSFPESEVSGRIDRLKDAQIQGVKGKTIMTNLRIDGKRDAADVVVRSKGNLIASVHTVPNFIELEPAKFGEYLKEEGLADVVAWREANGESGKPGKERYSKYAKSLLLSGTPDEFFKHQVGFIIEIIPEVDPSTLAAGAALPIQVLFRGKPAVDMQIETAWAGTGGQKTLVVGRTGADGRLSIPLTSAGKWRIHTIKMERCADQTAANWESFWASLTFELRK